MVGGTVGSSGLPEDARQWLEQACGVLHEFQRFHRTNMVDALADGVYDAVPAEWAEALQRLAECSHDGSQAAAAPPEGLDAWLAQFIWDRKACEAHEDAMPRGLASFLRRAHALQLEREPCALHACAFPQYLRQVKGFSPKKEHETTRHAAVLRQLARQTRCELVVDVGSGSGYLGQVLLNADPSMAVVGIEGDISVHTLALKKLRRMFELQQWQHKKLSKRKSAKQTANRTTPAKQGSEVHDKRHGQQHEQEAQQRQQRQHQQQVPASAPTKLLSRMHAVEGIFSVHTPHGNLLAIDGALTAAGPLLRENEGHEAKAVEEGQSQEQQARGKMEERGLLTEEAEDNGRPQPGKKKSKEEKKAVARVQPGSAGAERSGGSDSANDPVCLEEMAQPQQRPKQKHGHSLRESAASSCILTCLHGCGDLTPCLLRCFAAEPRCKGLVLVGCCYHAITPVDGREKAWYIKRRNRTNAASPADKGDGTAAVAARTTAAAGGNDGTTAPTAAATSTAVVRTQRDNAHEAERQRMLRANTLSSGVVSGSHDAVRGNITGTSGSGTGGSKNHSNRGDTGATAGCREEEEEEEKKEHGPLFYSFPMSIALQRILQRGAGFHLIPSFSLRRAAQHRRQRGSTAKTTQHKQGAQSQSTQQAPGATHTGAAISPSDADCRHVSNASTHAAGATPTRGFGGGSLHVSSTLYRNVLEEVKRRHPEWTLTNVTTRVVLKRDCRCFDDYVRAVLKTSHLAAAATAPYTFHRDEAALRQRFPWAHVSLLPALDELVHTYDAVKTMTPRVAVFLALQGLVEALLEDVIVVDRCLFVQERVPEAAVSLVPLFDQYRSPRCFAIVATRPQRRHSSSGTDRAEEQGRQRRSGGRDGIDDGIDDDIDDGIDGDIDDGDDDDDDV